MKKKHYNKNELLSYYYSESDRNEETGLFPYSTILDYIFGTNETYSQWIPHLSEYINTILSGTQKDLMNLYFYKDYGRNRVVNDFFIELWNSWVLSFTDFYYVLNLVNQSIAKYCVIHFGSKWQKLDNLWNLTYNPIVDTSESLSRESKQSNQSSFSSSSAGSSTNNIQNKRRGFGALADSSTTATAQDTTSSNNVISQTSGLQDDNKLNESVTRMGMTRGSYQELIKREFDNSKLFEVLDTIYNDILSVICEKYIPLKAEYDNDVELVNANRV